MPRYRFWLPYNTYSRGTERSSWPTQACMELDLEPRTDVKNSAKYPKPHKVHSVEKAYQRW